MTEQRTGYRSRTTDVRDQEGPLGGPASQEEAPTYVVRRSFRFTKMGKAWLFRVYVPSETRRRGQVVLWLCKTSSSHTTLQNIEVIKTLVVSRC